MSVPPPIPVARSTFVSVVAWIFIGLSSFITFMLLIYSFLLPRLLLPMLRQQIPLSSMPPNTGWYLDHLVWLCYLLLLLAVVHLLAAIGLLKRRNWARQLFIGLLGLDILNQLANVAMQWWLLEPMQRAMMHAQFQSFPQPLPAEQQAQIMLMMDSIMKVTHVINMILLAGFIVLFAWLIKRLCSATIRHEFVPPSIAA